MLNASFVKILSALALTVSATAWSAEPAADASKAKAAGPRTAAPTSGGASGGGGGERGAIPAIPQAVTSFGAGVTNGSVYVYGGHVGKAHDYHKDTQVDMFASFPLASPGGSRSWETLPTGPALQGLAMVAHDGWVYRIGGMQARNGEKDQQDLHSTAEVARFDVVNKKWEPLPALPAALSSHDAIVHDNKLYVLGGWTLKGDSDGADWMKRGWTLDLKNPTQWVELPEQGFGRRAIAVVATTKNVYVIGGLTEDGTSNRVDIYNPATRTWTQGPELPAEGRMKGFGGAGVAVGDDVFFSGFSGRMYRIREGDKAWTDTGYDLKEPRFFHRAVNAGNGKLLMIAGSGRTAGMLTSVETVDVQTLLAKPASQLPKAPAAGKAEARGADAWPGFRGFSGGVSSAAGLPLTWSDEQNIAWRSELQGTGQSSPIVQSGHVYATSVDYAQKVVVVTALDLATGKTLWAHASAASRLMEESGYVSKSAPTPLADAGGVYAFFETGDLVALTHDGKERWSRSLTKEYGPFGGNHGLGSSPAMTGNAIIVLADHDGPAYLLAIDKATGKNLWKTDRPARVSWTSPVVDGDEVIVSSSGVVQSFEAATGKMKWQVEGIAGNTVASPLVTAEGIVIGTGEPAGLVLIGRDGSTRWSSKKAGASFASPVISGTTVCTINKAGVAFGVNPASGEVLWSVRLPATSWATPIVSGPLVYFFCQDGKALVLRVDGAEPQTVAQNAITLAERSRVYGAAAVDGRLVLRSDREVICIGNH